MAALLVAIVVSFVIGGGSAARGCIDATVPYSFGGQQIKQCGASARATCAAIGTVNGFSGQAGRAVAVACRKAGLPVGP